MGATQMDTFIFLLLPENVTAYKLCNVQRACKVCKGAKIRNRYNQVPHLTQDTNGKVPNISLDTTNENQEISTFKAGDYKAHIN